MENLKIRECVAKISSEVSAAVYKQGVLFSVETMAITMTTHSLILETTGRMK